MPCRGDMLDSSILRPFDREMSFTDGCLRRMDSGTRLPYPPEVAEQNRWASGLGTAAVALAGLTWLPLAASLGWRVRTRLVALVPLMFSLVTMLASWSASRDLTRSESASLPVWLWAAPEVAAVLAVVAVVRWEAELQQPVVRLIVLAWGATAFGLVHLVVDYAAMVSFNSANWDVPPGTGYGTVAVLVAAATVTLLTTAWDGRERYLDPVPRASTHIPRRPASSPSCARARVPAV